MQVLHRIHCGWVEPTRACGDRDNEQGALETTDPFQLVQRDPGALLQAVARVVPGVDPDGTLRFAPEERRDIRWSRSIENEALPVASDIIPFDERPRAAGCKIVFRGLVLVIQHPVQCGKSVVQSMQGGF